MPSPKNAVPSSQMAPQVGGTGPTKKLYLIPIAVIIAICLAFLLLPNFFRLSNLQRAMSNLNDEVMERIYTTPFKSLFMLVNTLENGTTEIFFDYLFWDTVTEIDLVIMSDSARWEYALKGNINMPGTRGIDFEKYVNANRAIAREFIESYKNLLVSFIMDADHSSRRTDIMVKGESIRATQITLNFTDANLTSLARDFNNLWEEDTITHDSFDLSLSGNMTLTFYIDEDDRILRAITIGDLMVNQNRVIFEIEQDYGADIWDTWTTTISIGSGPDDMETIIMYWDMFKSGNRYEHIVSMLDGSISVLSDWDMDNGAFMLRAQYGFYRTDFVGHFIVDGDSFRLKLDDTSLGWGSVFGLEITTSPYVDMGDADFIDISDWDWDMFQDWVEQLINAYIT